jgi:hypothetical protein
MVLFGVLDIDAHLPLFPIVNLLGSYDPLKKTIKIYLVQLTDLESNLRRNNQVSLEVNFLLKLVIYHLIGRLICHRMITKGFQSDFNKFNKCGEDFKVFVSQMIAYHCLNEKEKKMFLKFNVFLRNEYHVVNHFVRDFQRLKKPKIDEVSISEVKELIKKAKKEKGNISQDFISDYFDSFIRNRVLHRDSTIIESIKPILTTKQMGYFGHLNQEHGFFID